MVMFLVCINLKYLDSWACVKKLNKVVNLMQFVTRHFFTKARSKKTVRLTSLLREPSVCTNILTCYP